MRCAASAMSVLNNLSADQFKKVAAAANRIGAQAKAAGLQFAYHNHNFEFRDLPMVHIKDFSHMEKPSTALFQANSPTPAELGRGRIDYAGIISAARAAHVKHFFIEQEPPFVDMSSLEAARVDYLALKTLISQSWL
jgi:hypothetical protein